MSVYPGPDEPRTGGYPAPGSSRSSELATTGPRPIPPELRERERQLEQVNHVVRLAFAPLHKRAFGIAIGTACGLFLFVFTAAHIVIDIPGALRLELLRAYFRGYSVTWAGALIGTVWAFAVGFVAGWFVAFCRNLIIAISVFLTRTRAELQQTREFLDHI